MTKIPDSQQAVGRMCWKLPLQSSLLLLTSRLPSSQHNPLLKFSGHFAYFICKLLHSA